MIESKESIGNINSCLAGVTCKIHSKSQIQIDVTTFQIVCKSCVKNNFKGIENLILESNNNTSSSVKTGPAGSFQNSSVIKNININEDSPPYKTCYKHAQEEAMFYCDDCSEFICKTCFATDHRNHSSSTYDLTVKTIKENLKKTLGELNAMKKTVDENLQSIQELNGYFVGQKNTFKSNLKEISDRIFNNLNFKAKEFSEEIEKIFNGIDFEVENSTQRLENTRKKANKMLNEFQSLFKEVESITSDKRICLFKQEKDGVLKENMKFLADLQFFLNQNLEKTKLKSLKEMENFSNKCNKFQKNAEIYENSVINTISSGIPNICMRVRRFKRYFFANTKYFKTDSVCMLTSHTINLVGFSICGLFNNKVNSNNNTPTSLKIGIKIYEMESVQNFDPSLPTICSTEVEIPVIFNVIDPVYQFYVKNAVTIHKDRVYYIFMNNLTQNNYIDIWSGETSKDKDDVMENQHSVICNNSNVKFNFINAIGVESDFNEFTGGILSDIIFSHID